jgi:hypothetical protein
MPQMSARGIFRDEGPYIAWFNDPAGNLLSVARLFVQGRSHTTTGDMAAQIRATGASRSDRMTGWDPAAARSLADDMCAGKAESTSRLTRFRTTTCRATC